VGLAFLILVAISFGYYRYLFPYGYRPCCMPCTMLGLFAYAYDHQGWYPETNGPGVNSLELLYPKYLGVELAGLTGNRSVVMHQLELGQDMGDASTSWIYFPGFSTNDNPKIAMIWERQKGVLFDGRRAAGHAVGFVDYSFRMIDDSDWPSFTNEQARLRQEAYAAKNR
jgi:hypothetical protein